MKILVLHGHLSMGGEEKILLSLLKNLDELNYDTDLLITWNHGKNNLFENEIPKSINYEFLFDNYDGKSKIIKELYRLKAKKQYPKLVKQKVEKEKCDVILDYSSNLKKYNSLNINIPIIAWVHFSLTFGEEVSAKKMDRHRKEYEKYDKIVPICDTMEEEFIKYLGVDKNKLEMIYNPIDLKLINEKANDVDEKYKKYLEKDYFLQVSRLTQQKQPEHLVDIYYKLKQHGVKEKLYFIGNGVKKEILEQKIKELKLENDVFLLGQIENPYPFFKNAKLFVHTGKYEGLPTVLLESLAMGTPVVAYDCPTGPKDILGKNDEYGKLVPLNDKDTFVNKVLELVNDEEKYEYYQKQALIRAKDFSMESNKIKLKKLLTTLN